MNLCILMSYKIITLIIGLVKETVYQVENKKSSMDRLRNRIQDLENEIGITLEGIVTRLKDDPSIEWVSIIENEKQKESWCKIQTRPKYYIIRSLCTFGKFKPGGDRVSTEARGHHQRAIIAHTEEKARAAHANADDEEVATECLESVLHRWSTPDPAALTVVQRVVHIVVRHARHTNSGGTTEDTTELMQQFDQQLIIRRPDPLPTTASEKERPIHDITQEFMRSVPTDVLMGVINLKKSYLELQLRQTELEPERLRAETERLRAEKDLYFAKNGGYDRKRKASVTPADDGDRWIRREIERPWNNQQSLSAMVLSATPSASIATTEETLAMVCNRVVKLDIPHRLRLLHNKKSGKTYKLVYVKPDWTAEVSEFVAAFWGEIRQPPATLAIPAAPDGSTHTVEESEQLNRVVVKSNKELNKGKKLVGKLPKGAIDLVAAVLPHDDDDVRMLSPEQRQQAVCWLDDDFVRTADVGEKWSVLWPPRPRAALTAGIIPTFIDVERDPIVPQLRHWLLERHAHDSSTLAPAPVYPAVQPNPPDLRPPEPVPLEMQGLEDHNVWKELVAAGLQCCLWSYYVNAYTRWDPQTHPIPSSAREPCPERLRQWRRLTRLNNDCSQEATGGGDLLTYRQICDCLGWQGLGHEAGNIQALTTALVRHRHAGTPVTAWLTVRSGGAPNLWKWRVCLYEMRVAAVFVERLRIVGCDNLKYLAGDVRSSSSSGCSNKGKG